MTLSIRRYRWLLLIVILAALVVLVGVAVPGARDVLAFVVALGLIGLFVGIRFAAAPLAHRADRPWEFWGGMSTDEAQTKPPLSLDPDGVVKVGPLPDVDPDFQGHPVGQKEDGVADG